MSDGKDATRSDAADVGMHLEMTPGIHPRGLSWVEAV